MVGLHHNLAYASGTHHRLEEPDDEAVSRARGGSLAALLGSSDERDAVSDKVLEMAVHYQPHLPACCRVCYPAQGAWSQTTLL
jgi:hypothetical protein